MKNFDKICAMLPRGGYNQTPDKYECLPDGTWNYESGYDIEMKKKLR
jgi:hypothetical protein